MRDRVGAWIRWLTVPWAPFAVAAAIIGAAAAPALLVSASNAWQVGATDDFAAGLSGDLTPAESGITVVTNAAQRGSAVVIATHDERILAVADEVVRLADGAVVDRDVA